MSQFSILDHFDWGGFIGAVLGAIASGIGVIYSLYKTSQFDRNKEQLQVHALYKAIFVELTLIRETVASFSRAVRTVPNDPSISPFLFWRREINPLLYPYKLSVIPANLHQISVFKENIIKATLTLAASFTEYREALNDVMSCIQESEFATKLSVLFLKRAALSSPLGFCFGLYAALCDEQTQDIKNLIATLEAAMEDLPEFWVKACNYPAATDRVFRDLLMEASATSP